MASLVQQEETWEFDEQDDTDYSDAEPEEIESECEDDLCVESLSNPECQEINLFESELDEESEELFVSKDESIVWTTKFPREGKRQEADIIKEKEGPKGAATEATTVLQCWELFFPSDTINQIVYHTNQKLKVIRTKYKRASDCSLTNEFEMRAFFGLLYFSGLMGLSHTFTNYLWKTNGLSPEYFRATMRENRFKLLLRALRFDDSATRNERKKTDKIAPIRQIWDEFNKNCLEYFTPGPNVTIDEMIAAFRGHCSFKQFIPSKPDRYGLKIFAMTDSEYYHTSMMELYIGQQPNKKDHVSNKPYDIVKRVCKSVLGTGRNITMDNWFSSIPLIINLLEKHQTTVVATLRKNKKEIPPAFINMKNREPCSSLFAFYRKMTMVSYVSTNKKKNCALLISSMHRSNTIDKDTGDKKKPEIITYYNQTKAAVDVVDQMRAKYNVARTSCRWPLTLFFAIMNIAVINACVIYNFNSLEKIIRKVFIETLFHELTKPHLIKRANQTHLTVGLRQTIRKCAGLFEPDVTVTTNNHGICSYCPRKKNRKTKSTCTSCSKLICQEHTIKMCIECHKLVTFSKEDEEE